ncbi:Enolase-phosphatase E1 [compost metagenome]
MPASMPRSRARPAPTKSPPASAQPTLWSFCMPIKAILTDIEGTTSAVSFVFDVLFPYAAAHLPDYVREHAGEPAVAEQLAAVRAESGEAQADVERCIEILLGWIAEDRKATPLKALQGMVWEQGYKAGQLKGHVYPDAVDALRRWHEEGYALYVYSSGSIQAQKLIFGCSEAGDLTPLFSGYFDTTSGGKREADSYRRIAGEIGLPGDEILFLSDVVQELDAAQQAGMQTIGLAREGGVLEGHDTVASFAVIDLARF